MREIDFGLPPLSTEKLPQFTDEDTCREWLARLPLTNIAVAQTRLTGQVNWLNHYPLRPDERLKILELLREPIEFLQDQCLQRFAGRPLPFSSSEQTAFDASQALWQELVTGYLHCLQATLDNTTGAASSPHLIASAAATRALELMLAIYLDACHANILIAPTFWRLLHLIFSAAEMQKVAQLPVDDNSHHKRTATSAYVEVLLLAAALPHELRLKQLHTVAEWARRWSSKVTILQQPPADQRTPSLCVDLGSNQAATFQAVRGKPEALRWLELSELRKSIKRRLVQLAQGESPQALQLGNGYEQAASEALLKRIYQCWCKGGLKQNAYRLQLAQRTTCHLVSGFEAIHYHLTGQISAEQDRSIYLRHREHEEIATFGRITTHANDETSKLLGFIPEEWRIVDQNATDLNLERSLVPPGRSLVGDQLIAVRLQDSEAFLLGKLSWIAMSGSMDALIARMHLFPGRAEGITLRATGSRSGPEQCSRGLFLPDVDQLGEPATVLTPPGWFAANRVIAIEVQANEMQQIRLDHVVERGADFERVTFEWI